MTSPRIHLRLAASAATLALALSGGCSTSDSNAEARDESAASPAVEPYDGYLDSMAVLGHSGATGEGAGGPESSWATGTNRDVNSVYLRILSKHDAIEGHAFNLAEGGADLGEIYHQAESAVRRDPAPEL